VVPGTAKKSARRVPTRSGAPSWRKWPKEGRLLPLGDVDVQTHMLVAAVSEDALMVATADDPDAALETGRHAVEGLLDRLIAEPRPGRR
jgi:hypothetical protein